jgi:ABC-type enterochelin transport system substrate-binding protein
VCISQFILEEISAAKSKVPKYLDDIKKTLITEVGSVQEKNEEKINREKHEICQLTSILKDNKQELFLLNKLFKHFLSLPSNAITDES